MSTSTAALSAAPSQLRSRGSVHHQSSLKLGGIGKTTPMP